MQAGALYGCDLVVRYFIDEAASGTAPAELLDAAPEPFDLPLTYGGVMQYTEQVGHRGLRWTAAGEDDGAFAAVAGTKVFDLDGSTVGTIEVVADIDQVTYLGTRLAHIGGGVDSGLTMASSFSWVRGEPEVADATRVEIRTGYSDRVVTSYFQVNLFRLGRVVLHAVVDTSASAVEDRTRLYLNGVRIPLDSFNDAIEPAQGAPLVLEPQSSLGVGNRAIGGRSPEGAIFYAAYYGRALSEEELEHNAGLLQIQDDAQP